MTSNQLMFIIFAVMIVVFSILTVTTRRILRAAAFLLLVLVSTSGLYFMLKYQFMAAVQLTLYAGGIVVLIIFSILLTSHISQKFEPVEIKKSVFSALAAVSGAIVAIITILDFNFNFSCFLYSAFTSTVFTWFFYNFSFPMTIWTSSSCLHLS